jgi:hypothetical protein
MAKRFTDSEKWKKPFIKKLPMQYKLLWFYLLDDCNHAGVWQVDLEIASLRIGYNLNLKDSITALNDKIKVFDNGEKWFIKDFIEFQYGELNEKNRAHKSVISVLTKYNLLSLNKPLTSPLQGAKDKDKDKDKEVLRVFDETSFENLERTFKTNKSEIRKKLEEFLEVEKITPTFRNKQIGEILKHFRNWLNYNKPKENLKTNNSAPWVSK